MKNKATLKIILISVISLVFTACEIEEIKAEEEKEYIPTLPIPNSGNEIRQMGIIEEWYLAKKNPIPATQIGYAYSEQLHDYKKAIEWFKYSNSMKPLPETSNYMCFAYQKLKQYDEAIKWCEDAINLGSKKALMNLASLYIDLKKYDEVVKLYENPVLKEDKVALTNLAYVYEEYFKDYKKAEVLYLKATKKSYYNAYQGLSYLYYAQLNEKIKSSAYAIALIGNKYSKSSVIKLLKDSRKFSNETIKKGYELQLNSKEFPIKYKGDLGL